MSAREVRPDMGNQSGKVTTTTTERMILTANGQLLPLSANPPSYEQEPSSLPPQYNSLSSTPTEQMMRVTCPPGAVPGDLVQIAVPGGSMTEVTVPEGVTAGCTFDILIPV